MSRLERERKRERKKKGKREKRKKVRQNGQNDVSRGREERKE